MRVVGFVVIGVVVLTGTSAEADRERGRDLFRQHCVGCHAIECNRSGPRLGDVIGRQAGTVPDFPGYSAALGASGILWTEQSLNEFLADPRGYLPGNAMSGYGKLDDAADRRDLIAFLSNPDTSLDLCY